MLLSLTTGEWIVGQLLDPAPPRFAALETPRGLVALRWVIGIVIVFGGPLRWIGNRFP